MVWVPFVDGEGAFYAHFDRKRVDQKRGRVLSLSRERPVGAFRDVHTLAQFGSRPAHIRLLQCDGRHPAFAV